jgi:hypothetical protein
MKWLKLLFKKRQRFDPRIFQPESWLSKKVQERMLIEQGYLEQNLRG